MKKFGLKIRSSDLNLAFDCRMNLIAEVDYISYPAPALSHSNFILAQERGIQLLPHSTELSLASAKLGASEIITRLKRELILTNSTYCGEHIGTLGITEGSPGCGYLFPPRFDLASVAQIVSNVCTLQKALNVPLALEFPVIYSLAEEELPFLVFLEILDRKLPIETGWLLDASHIFATCQNLSLNFKEVLKAFATSKRKIFEIHLSSFQRDASGVWHDKHFGSQSEFKYNVLALASLLAFEGVTSQNWTVEANITKPEMLHNAILGISELKKISESFNFEWSSLLKSYEPMPVYARKEAEIKGRVQIAKNRLSKQLGNEAFNELCNLLLRQKFSLDEFLGNWLSGSVELAPTPVGTYSKEVDSFNLAVPIVSYFAIRSAEHLLPDFRKLLIRGFSYAFSVGQRKEDKLHLKFLAAPKGNKSKNILLVKTNRVMLNPPKSANASLGEDTVVVEEVESFVFKEVV